MFGNDTMGEMVYTK